MRRSGLSNLLSRGPKTFALVRLSPGTRLHVGQRGRHHGDKGVTFQLPSLFLKIAVTSDQLHCGQFSATLFLLREETLF